MISVVDAGEHNLARLGERTLERLGDRDAIFFEGSWHRAEALHERACRLAGGLSRLGVLAGDRVAVMMSNSPDVGVIYTALWRAGAVITPAIFLLSEADLRGILVDSEARAVVTTPEFLDKVRAAAGGVDSLRWIICSGDQPATISLDSLGSGAAGPIVERLDSDLAALMYTGGTTGRAKGVMLSHDNLWHAGRATHEASHVPGVTRSLIPLPLSHSFGLLVTVSGLHTSEPGIAVLMRWFDPSGFLELIETHRLQQAAVVPSMLQILLGMPLEEHDLSSLRFLGSGAAPLAAEVVHELERRLPGLEIREGYGLTESAAIISTNPPGRRRLGSVGRPVPGCQVQVVDDAGRVLPAGERGEIRCRSATVMQGYWKAPELTAATLRDGWLHTGDIGQLDEDGYIFISDRKKDLIIRGGFNVFPRDVEEALLEHPALAMAAVVGRPDLTSGEEVVAFVSTRPGAQVSEEELVEFGRARLGGYKYPREVHVIDAIPLTPVGKVDRKAVRKLL